MKLFGRSHTSNKDATLATLPQNPQFKSEFNHFALLLLVYLPITAVAYYCCPLILLLILILSLSLLFAPLKSCPESCATTTVCRQTVVASTYKDNSDTRVNVNLKVKVKVKLHSTPLLILCYLLCLLQVFICVAKISHL